MIERPLGKEGLTLDRTRAGPPFARRLRRVVVLSLLAAGAVALLFCREPLGNRIFKAGVLANDAPTEEAISQVIDAAKDRQSAIRAFWNTGKIVHREAAIRHLSHFIPVGKPIPAELESWVRAAGLDPDMDVRETALGILREHKDPALAAICLAQLRDIDPEARQLGLENLRQVSANVGVPSVIPALDDPDPRIVVTVLKLLENWTGQSFGVRLAEVVPSENKQTGLLEYGKESKAKAEAGAARAKMWWTEHRSEFAPIQLEAPAAALAAVDKVPAGDFSLSKLNGQKVRLSEFRGKVVLINFWTTWCTACIGEMPELIELQKRHHEQLVILGISLDAAPDDNDNGHHGDRASLNEIRGKVARAAETRGINYTILLDDSENVGGRFNGGELPTTVIVDAEGYVRRRFIGARSLPVFEAMIAEASQPLRQSGKVIGQ